MHRSNTSTHLPGVVVHHEHHAYPVDTSGRDAATASAFFETIFAEAIAETDGSTVGRDVKSAPLCRVMVDVIGGNTADCHTAAAFTSWRIQVVTEDSLHASSSSSTSSSSSSSSPLERHVPVPEPDPRYAFPAIYDAVTREKAANVVVMCWVKTATPQWSQHAAASASSSGLPEAAGEVVRFEARTAHHEAGHKLAGVNAARSIYRFIQALPMTLPSSWSSTDIRRLNNCIEDVCTNFYIERAHVADELYDTMTTHGVVQGAESAPEVGLGNDQERLFGSFGIPLPPVRHVLHTLH